MLTSHTRHRRCPPATGLWTVFAAPFLLAGCVGGSSGFRLNTGVMDMKLGSAHTCVAVLGNGLRCWGANDQGQLGNGTTTASSTPVEPTAWGSGPGSGPYPGGGKTTRDFAAGGSHTCAADGNTGRAYCWGSDRYGQLGVGANRPNALFAQPVRQNYFPGAATPINMLAAGENSTCAIYSAGKVGCWGFGYGTVPVEVPGLVGPTKIAAGGKQVCVIEQSGTVRCWEMLFPSASAPWPPSTTFIKTITGIVAKKVTVGRTHACAIDQSDQVRCWGLNDFGQLGTGNRLPAIISTVARGGAPIKATEISAGEYHTCALTPTGSVECWGDNSRGQTGDPNNALSSTPYTVIGSGSSAIGAGGRHSCSRYLDGTVYRMKCWGANDNGQLGVPTTLTWSATPVQVTGLP